MWLVDVQVLDEDTGTEGVIHIVTPDESEARELVALIIAEEDADPADFTVRSVTPNWECVGHGDGTLCGRPLLN